MQLAGFPEHGGDRGIVTGLPLPGHFKSMTLVGGHRAPAGCRSVNVTSGGLRLLQDLRRSFATYDKRLLDAAQAAGLPIDARLTAIADETTQATERPGHAWYPAQDLSQDIGRPQEPRQSGSTVVHTLSRDLVTSQVTTPPR